MIQITISKRAAAVIVLALVLVVPGVAGATHIFSDVDDANVHAQGIEWVANVGVTGGCGDGSTYCPNDPVTRAQMGTFLHRLSGNAPGIDPSVAAATALQATTADSATTASDADTLDGKDVTELETFAVGADTGAAPAGVLLTTTFTSMLSVDVTAPSAGQVTVNSSANVFHNTANGDVACAILRATDSNPSFGTNILGVQWFESEGLAANDGNIGGTRVFDVAADSTTTFQLRCREGADGGQFFGATMSALFTPAP